MKTLQRAKIAYAHSNVSAPAKPVSFVAKLIIVAIMAAFLAATFLFVFLVRLA
jgi:hypothetical protein